MKSNNVKENGSKDNFVVKCYTWIKKSKILNQNLLKYFIILIVFVFATNPSLIPFLPYNVKKTLTDALSDIFGDVTQIVKVININWITIFQLIVMTLIIIIITNITKTIIRNINSVRGRVKTFLTLLDSISQYFSIIVGIIWGLSIIGVNISTIFASVGVAALIVGFSAESLIADVVTGTFLLFENQYNVGDIIDVGEFRGTIVKIGIRTTSIKDAGNNIKVITNSDMRNVINRSCTKSKAVCDLVIPVSEDLENIENIITKLLKEIGKNFSNIILEEPQYLGVQNLKDTNMTLRIVATVDEKDIFDAQRILNREIKKGFENQKIGLYSKKQDKN